jgi:hypothetical protein
VLFLQLIAFRQKWRRATMHHQASAAELSSRRLYYEHHPKIATADCSTFIQPLPAA